MVNAPLNPIGYIENRNQLNLKGDVAYLQLGNEYLNFDIHGNRIFLFYNLLDKEKARQTKSTYLKLDDQKKLVYRENFFFDTKTFYFYNSNGTISKTEIQGKYPAVTTFSYDIKKRLTKKTEIKDNKTILTEFTYSIIGNDISIQANETTTENNQRKSRTFEYTYRNGLLMKYKEDQLEELYSYTFDTKGNVLTIAFGGSLVDRYFYYHSELKQWDAWSWKYIKKSNYWSPFLTVGNRIVNPLNFSSKDVDNFTDVLFFEPITSTTLVAENVVTSSGLSTGVSDGKLSALKGKNLMYSSVDKNIKFIVEGTNMTSNIKQAYVGKMYLIYNADNSLTYWCKDFEKGKKFTVFEDLGNNVLLWLKNEKNDLYLWQNGSYIGASGHTLGETLDDGSKLIYKDQKPVWILENFKAAAQNIFYQAIPYENQKGFKNNTNKGFNTVDPVLNNFEKDQITGSYNENETLYVRKIKDTTVYYYQNGKRINQPLNYSIVKEGQSLRLYTTYTKDYYSAYALNDMSPEKLYPLTDRAGVFYLYVNKNNEHYTFQYRGKKLLPTQYELYVSKGDYTVLKLKSDNSIYLFKSNLIKGVTSNSQAKGVLVHFTDNRSIFVEKGAPTQPTYWKINKESDQYYLVNSLDNRKFTISDFDKSINWGIYTIH